MTLADFLLVAQQVLAPFIPLWSVEIVLVCLIFGIFFSLIVMILRRV
jgi:hypothetical protein